MKNQIIHEIESELKVTQESITKAYPSIYSKEDVLKMLNGFVENITRWVVEAEEDESPEKAKAALGLTFEQRMELEGLLRQAIERKLDRMDNEMIDFDSAEFHIEYGNTLRLEDVDINTDAIVDELEESISQVIGDFFQPIEEEVKEVIQ